MNRPNGEDRHALITGAGKRVGAEIARYFARSGWTVTIHYRASGEEAETLAASLRRDGADARTVRADLADATDLAGLIQRVEADGPLLSCLVNNAAIFFNDEAGGVTPDNLTRHFLVNAAAPILLAQAFAAARERADRPGVVVNLLDNKLFAPNADYFSYSVAKFALYGATRMLAMALSPRVRVCGVAPSILLVSGEQSAENFGQARSINPQRLPTNIDDICRTVLFLAETDSVNGEIVVVDRGQTLMNLPRDVAFLPDDLVKRFR